MRYRAGRQAIAALCGPLLLASLVSCSGTDSPTAGSVNVGLLTPLSGALEQVGGEAQNAFELYVEINDGKLGGRNVNLSIRDEGDGPETSVPSVKKLINDDKADVIVGATSSANYIAVAPETTKAEVPLVGNGGQPDLKDAGIDFEWLWQTSFTASQPGASIGPYLADAVDGPVYAMAPNYEGGYALMGGFTKSFTDAGGKLANTDNKPTWTEWPPKSLDFSEYFEEIAASDAKAIFAYYADAPAIEFLKQYATSPAKDIPMYGVLLTEGPVLQEEGEAAEGVNTVLNYASDIDNAENRRFVSEWGHAYPGNLTSLYSMAGWDAALVMDQAISRIPADEEVTPAAINKAIGELGTINSVRGSWQFDGELHVPVQRYYLRTVAKDGPTLANVVTKDLVTIGG